MSMVSELKRLAQDGRVDTVPLSDDNRFWSFLRGVRGNKVEIGQLRREARQADLLAIDPGETTGVAVWHAEESLIYLFQLETPVIEEGYKLVEEVIDRVEPAHLRVEDYRVYGHMTEQHSFASLHTAQFIGAIRTVASQKGIPLSVCLAMHAKTFWTDSKLEICGLYNKGLKHARDAQRHLLRYMCE